MPTLFLKKNYRKIAYLALKSAKLLCSILAKGIHGLLHKREVTIESEQLAKPASKGIVRYRHTEPASARPTSRLPDGSDAQAGQRP